MTGTITKITRLVNSTNGNPRFAICIDGAPYTTGSDHSFNYEVGNPGLRVGDTVTYTLTRSGKISHLASI